MKDLSILVLDIWMPTPDRDSASLRIVNLLSILEQIAGKVTFGVGDSPGWRNSNMWQSSAQPFQHTTIEFLEGHTTIESHLKQQGQDYRFARISRKSRIRGLRGLTLR